MKDKLLNLTIFSLTLISLVILIEFIVTPILLNAKKQELANQLEVKEIYIGGTMFTPDEELGFKTLPKTSVQGQIISNGKVVNDVHYYFDQYGRRISEGKYEQILAQGSDNILGTDNDAESSNQLVIFGCSYAVGAFLEYKDTLNSNFETKLEDTSVFNYAQSAYGPNQMLAILEKDTLTSEVSSSIPSKGVYFYMFDHINRSNLNWNSYHEHVFLRKYPYFEITEKGDVVRKGNFETSEPGKLKLLDFLSNLNTIKYLGINPIPIDYDQEIFKTFKIIEKSKEVFESKYSGKFYVFIYPYIGSEEYREFHEENTEKLVKLLKESGIEVIMFEEDDYITDARWEYITSEGKFHPNGKLNDLVTNLIIEKINQ